MLLKSQISSIFNASLPCCPSCRAETAEDDVFCQECGAALPVAEPVAESRSAVRSGLERLHPSLSKPVVALPLVVFAIVAIGAISFFLVGFEKSYSGFSNQYVVDQAHQAYKDSRFDEAATFLERLALTHSLDEEQKTLLNDIYLARSSQRMQRLDYAGAMSDLNKIPPQYSKFVLVSGRKNELTELIKVRQAQQQASAFPMPKNHLKTDKVASSHSSKKVAAPAAESAENLSPPSAISSTNERVANEIVANERSTNERVADERTAHERSANERSANERSANERTVNERMANARIASRVDSPSRRSDVSVDAAAGQTPPSETPARTDTPPRRPEKSKSAKISENDQVRYNELLAAYFSQEHKQSSGASEPPSLKEWIDSGRPKF